MLKGLQHSLEKALRDLRAPQGGYNRAGEGLFKGHIEIGHGENGFKLKQGRFL